MGHGHIGAIDQLALRMPVGLDDAFLLRLAVNDLARIGLALAADLDAHRTGQT
jgi:hypothetical protein